MASKSTASARCKTKVLFGSRHRRLRALLKYSVVPDSKCTLKPLHDGMQLQLLERERERESPLGFFTGGALSRWRGRLVHYHADPELDQEQEEE